MKLIAWLTPCCQELTRLSSESLERKLSLRERLSLFLHNTVCVWCKRYDGQLKTIHDGVEGKGDTIGETMDVSLSDEGKNRLKALLKEK